MNIIYPLESQKSIKKLLWKKTNDFESQIRYNTAIEFWNYSRLNFDAIIGLSAIISTGYLPTGSDSEELYHQSLPDYANILEEMTGKIERNRVLWETTAYIHLLIIYHKYANNSKYESELSRSTEFLINIIKKEESSLFNKSNIQLIGYISSVLIEVENYSENKKINEINLKIKKIIQNYDNWPDELETKILLLFNLLKISDKADRGIEEKYKKIIEEYQSSTYKKRDCKPYMLRLISEFSKKKNIKYQVPYFTLTGDETPFFGIIVETILDSGDHIETEKRSKKIIFQETDLRNRFLSNLKIRFKGLVTSETFSRKGLTDIYVINPNNFNEHIIIECKIFKEKGKYIESIDQVMKYLQEKDGRAVLLTFIRNTKYYETLENIKNSIKDHPTYLKESLKQGILRKDTWGDNYFTSIHKNKSGSDVKIHHIYIDIRKEHVF